MLVSELARELSVSVQSIYKKINKSMRNELYSHVKTIKGQKVIDEQGAEIIKNSFKSNYTDTAKNGEYEYLNHFKQISTLKENESLKEQIQILKDSNNAVESILNQFKSSLNDEISFLRKRIQELEKEKEQNRIDLEREREHSRQQAQSFSELSDKLAELTKNEQILMLQSKNTYLLSDENSSENESQENKKSLSLWQRIFKQKK